MKKVGIIVSIINFIFAIGGFAQHTFTWSASNPFYGYVVEKELQQFYFVGRYVNKTTIEFDSAAIKKWSFNNDSIIKTIVPDTHLYKKAGFELAVPHSTNGIIAIGQMEHKIFPDTNYIWIVGFDSSLNQLWELTYPLARRYLFHSNVKKLKNGNWVTVLNTYNANWVVHDQYYLLEFTENGILARITPADTSGFVDDIAVHPITGNIYCFGDYLYPHNPSVTWINIYDSNYNLINHKPVFPDDLEYTLFPPFGGEWLNEDTLIFSGRKNYFSATPQDEDICLYYMKETDSIIPLKETCYRRLNTVDFTTQLNFCQTKDQKIIQIGALDIEPWEKTWIGCYDMNFNLLYHRIFTSDTLRNFPSGVFPCSDSGYFVLNTTSSSFFYPTDAVYYTMKFDKNGNIPSLEIESKIKIERHLLYPNPGTAYFMLELSRELLDKGQCILELYNTNGRLQNQWTFEGNQVQIITDKIPIGLYYYRVIQNNKLIVTGKWIKIIK